MTKKKKKNGGKKKREENMVQEVDEKDFEAVKEDGIKEEHALPDWIPFQPLVKSNLLLHARILRWRHATLEMLWLTAHPIGIL